MASVRTGAGAGSLVVSAVVAGVLATIAVITVEQAGCDDPGHYVVGARGYELIGGCVEPGDLPVSPSGPWAPAPGIPDPRSPLRP
ncbi:MAG: hypothetical protein ACT4O0_10335 [Pseudonocardia sp.]|jgi:hypothetical protein